MKACQELPEGYAEVLQIKLQDDRKASVLVNVLGGVVMVAVLVAGAFMVSPLEILDMDSVGGLLIRFAVFLLGMVAYFVLHELTHGAVMKAVGAKHVRFGFTGMYAYAGSLEDYFDKGSYRLTALAPVVVWGIVFGVLAVVVPSSWFWVVWFLQAANIGGSMGDVYVTAKLWKKPATILVRDTGVEMRVFDRS
ncbi:MAG: DUF3267 domain-containing protein [Eggerthellaceae bacterium]|nr:DUF3267 domain-containing protein [Eggerthellaceae bacterium]